MAKGGTLWSEQAACLHTVFMELILLSLPPSKEGGTTVAKTLQEKSY